MEEAVVFTTGTMNTYLDQLNIGFSKVCEVMGSSWHRLFKSHPRVLHRNIIGTSTLHFPATNHDSEQDELYWLLCNPWSMKATMNSRSSAQSEDLVT